MECLSENERYENGCLAHDMPEMLALDALERVVKEPPEEDLQGVLF